MSLVDFLQESNRIEGIHGMPSIPEIKAAELFLEAPEMSVGALGKFHAVIAPKKPLRSRSGMDVRVGSYIAPPGGPNIPLRLAALTMASNTPNDDPWERHCAFEMLHPYMDGNGRTGRLLWVWQTLRLGRDPFRLPFLQAFYYETLGHSR